MTRKKTALPGFFSSHARTSGALLTVGVDSAGNLLLAYSVLELIGPKRNTYQLTSKAPEEDLDVYLCCGLFSSFSQIGCHTRHIYSVLIITKVVKRSDSVLLIGANFRHMHQGSSRLASGKIGK